MDSAFYQIIYRRTSASKCDLTWLVRGERNVLTLREAFLHTCVSSLSQSLVLQWLIFGIAAVRQRKQLVSLQTLSIKE